MLIPCAGSPPSFIDTEADTTCSLAQVRAIILIASDAANRFHAACHNPLACRYRSRAYSFVFAFYDRIGNRCTCWITPTGKIEYMDGPRAGWVDHARYS